MPTTASGSLTGAGKAGGQAGRRKGELLSLFLWLLGRLLV